MTFYKYKYNFQPPYQVLLDGTFCQAALQARINVKEQIENYLPDNVNIVTTKCAIKELEKIGGPVAAALKVMRQFKVTHCPHTPLRTATECLSHLARRSKNPDKTKYLVATQDPSLLEQLRNIAGVPLLTIIYKTVYLEKPSEKSIVESSEEPEIQKAKELKKEILGEGETSEVKKKKRKGPKGPNPLSCLKSKKKKIGNLKKEGEKKARRKKKKSKVVKSDNPVEKAE